MAKPHPTYHVVFDRFLPTLDELESRWAYSKEGAIADIGYCSNTDFVELSVRFSALCDLGTVTLETACPKDEVVELIFEGKEKRDWIVIESHLLSRLIVEADIPA